MDTARIVNRLEEITTKLHDAEMGYREIARATDHPAMRTWCNKYANERYNMRRQLESQASLMGRPIDSSPSATGALHRAFIDVKINNTDFDFSACINEIERGSTSLLDEYADVLHNVKLPSGLSRTLNDQRATIDFELNSLTELRDEVESVTA